jgi:hypothetical protein
MVIKFSIAPLFRARPSSKPVSSVSANRLPPHRGPIRFGPRPCGTARYADLRGGTLRAS